MRITTANLIRGELGGDTASVTATPADLPDGLAPESAARLDGDHVDAEIELQHAAAVLQQKRVDAFGGDDPRTMIATSYLAYALGLGDHIDGQLEAAAVLAQDAYEGLADAEDERSEHVGVDDVETARRIHRWITNRLDRGM